VLTDRHIMFRPRPPFSRHHREFASRALNAKKLGRSRGIEFAVNPLDELSRHRVRQTTSGGHPVYLLLHLNVCRGFKLQISAFRVLIKPTSQSVFDFTRAGMVALDQIAVTGIHQTHERREVRGGSGMKTLAECRRLRGKFSDQVRDRFRR